MIKIALKHFIYEACINKMFSAIQRNFSLPENTLQCGDYYSTIVFEWMNTTNVQITYDCLECTVVGFEGDMVRIQYHGTSKYKNNYCIENWMSGTPNTTKFYTNTLLHYIK